VAATSLQKIERGQGNSETSVNKIMGRAMPKMIKTTLYITTQNAMLTAMRKKELSVEDNMVPTNSSTPTD
jgi:hypothetical protein